MRYKLIAIAAHVTILIVIALAGVVASRVSGTLAALVVIALLFGLLTSATARTRWQPCFAGATTPFG